MQHNTTTAKVVSMRRSEPRTISTTDTAKLIRAALKDAFPAIKFSVISRKYAGGASIDVTWTDGPVASVVEKITDRFRGADFDGMTDSKNYVTHEVKGVRVHYRADFVFAKRSFSADAMQTAADVVAGRKGVTAPRVIPETRLCCAYLEDTPITHDVMQLLYATDLS